MGFDYAIHLFLEFYVCFEFLSSHYRFSYILDKFGNFGALWSIKRIRAENIRVGQKPYSEEPNRIRFEKVVPNPNQY